MGFSKSGHIIMELFRKQTHDAYKTLSSTFFFTDRGNFRVYAFIVSGG